MFLDIRDSTAIAERIGDEKAHALITDVFFHADSKITAHKGEILSYNGDEIVASWPSDVGLKQGRCLACYHAISEDLKARAESYKERFGVAPGASVIFTTEPDANGPKVTEPEALVTKTGAVPSSSSSPMSS